MEPLISIIVPVYNTEKYLKECIESILNQTYKNIQLILVNDGSTDDSLNICKSYKQIDNRVLVIDKPNSGVSETRNFGISVANGDYIGFVDSDDYIEKVMYEILLNKIISDNSDLCAMIEYTINSFYIDEIKNVDQTITGFEALSKLLLLRFPASLCACLYSKNIIKEKTLNKNIHFFEDFEFNFRILLESKVVSVCNKKLYNYRANETGANHQEINEKRMTCLNIYESVTSKIRNYNTNLEKYAAYFRAHCLISIISSLSKKKKAKNEYYTISQDHAKKMLCNTMSSRFVPFTYKFAILIFSLFPKATTNFIYYIKYSAKKRNRLSES